MTRILTGLLLVVISLYVIFASPKWLFVGVMALVASLCFYEYSGIVGAYGLPAPGIPGLAAGLLVLLLPKVDATLFTVLTILVLAAALRHNDFSKALPSSGALLLGVLYIFGTFRCGIFLRDISPNWLFFALGLNWVGDTAALYVGRAFGKHPLAPRASPKKTWEGAIASLLASVIFGAVFLPYSLPAVSVLQAGLVAAVAGVAGLFGDLAESVIKRGAGVKDSGSTLPGHGGWLDRVDSSMFSMPVVCLYLSLANYQ
jgi:phosphatidate cytidylyltransferase